MVRSPAFICIISLLIIVLIIIFHFNFTPYEIIGEIANDWRQDPIYDLSLGVQPDLFINDAFEGTVKGCTCPLTKEIKIGNCMKVDKLKKCYNVPPVRSIPYGVWDSTRIKRIIKSRDYLSLNFQKDCSDTFPKKCGIIDNQGNFLCLRNNESCPINDIIILDKNEASLPGYKILNLKNKKIL